MSSTIETQAGTTVWTLDPTHTLVEFSAKHMMITTVKGRIPNVTGTIVVNAANPSLSTVEAELDAASIDTGTEQRDGHLRSADFLDVETFPAISFRSKRIDGGYQGEGDRFKLVGDLTIRGITREVVLDVTYEGSGADPWGGERVSFSAETRLDRREFGLQWNVALETGGILVSNDIRVTIEAQAVKQA